MKKYRLNKKKFAGFIFSTLLLLVIIWFVVSWGYNCLFHVSYDDIVNGDASKWNMLNIAVRLGQHI